MGRPSGVWVFQLEAEPEAFPFLLPLPFKDAADEDLPLPFLPPPLLDLPPKPKGIGDREGGGSALTAKLIANGVVK